MLCWALIPVKPPGQLSTSPVNRKTWQLQPIQRLLACCLMYVYLFSKNHPTVPGSFWISHTSSPTNYCQTLHSGWSDWCEHQFLTEGTRCCSDTSMSGIRLVSMPRPLDESVFVPAVMPLSAFLSFFLLIWTPQVSGSDKGCAQIEFFFPYPFRFIIPSLALQANSISDPLDKRHR